MANTKTDYDRACEQEDYIGTIACGSSQVLILGDEPLQSAFVTIDKGVIIVRWVSCASHQHASEAITRLPLELPLIEESKKFHLNESGLVMFDSALGSIDAVVAEVAVDIDPGIFKVTVERYKKAGFYEFLVHRLLRD